MNSVCSFWHLLRKRYRSISARFLILLFALFEGDIGRRRIGGIRRVGSAISTTTVQRGQALSRACRTHTCEPAETIGNFLECQSVIPWTYAVALERSATVTNRPASNVVPSRIIA